MQGIAQSHSNMSGQQCVVGMVGIVGTAMCSGGHSVQWAQRPWAKLGLTPMVSQWARLRADHHERRYDHPPQCYI